MTMILTYKYRLKDRTSRKMLREHAVAVNQVWNYCCAQQRDVQSRYRAGEKPRHWSSHYELAALTRCSKELRLNAQSIQNVCQMFVKSRDKAGHAPRFRSSFGARRSLGWVPFQKQSRQIAGNSITYLGKRYRFWEGGRPLPENAKGGCFVEDARGRWYVCLQVEVQTPPATGNSAVGIDLGLKSLATLSDGNRVMAPRHFRALEHKLSIAQRAGNRRRIRAIHAKITNTRKDFLHKLSTQLVRDHSFIAVGDVNSSQLAKTRMAKSVLDAGWSMFRSQLRYKCQKAGAMYVDVDENFTTQTCSSCGALPPGRPKGIAGLGIRDWDCSECGTSHDRDVNAAKNILNLALSAQRLDEGSRGVVANCNNRTSPIRPDLVGVA